MAVLHGTIPYEAETAWLFRRYQHRTVFPFAVLRDDLPLARARGKSIDRAMSLPGKLALIRLSYLRRHLSPHRSSLEPKGGVPAIADAVVLRQPEVAMADRLELIHEGERLRAAPLFADLSVAEAAVLGTRLERMTIAPGEIILREGEDGDALFVVESGNVQVQGGGTILAELGPGRSFRRDRARDRGQADGRRRQCGGCHGVAPLARGLPRVSRSPSRHREEDGGNEIGTARTQQKTARSLASSHRIQSRSRPRERACSARECRCAT